MTAIERLGGPGRNVGVGRRRPAEAGGTAFALPETSAAPPEVEDIGSATAPALIGAMLALQEAEPAGARDRIARKHGETILGALRALQIGLLDGDAEPDTLRRLARLAEALPEAADPKLAALVSAVALRARVELARVELCPRQAATERASTPLV